MRAIFEDLILSIPREKYDVSATAVSVPRLIDVRLHFKPFVFIQAKLMEKDWMIESFDPNGIKGILISVSVSSLIPRWAKFHFFVKSHLTRKYCMRWFVEAEKRQLNHNKSPGRATYFFWGVIRSQGLRWSGRIRRKKSAGFARNNRMKSNHPRGEKSAESKVRGRILAWPKCSIRFL